MRDFLGTGSFLGFLGCAGYGVCKLWTDLGPEHPLPWFATAVILFMTAGMLLNKKEKPKGPLG